MGMARLRRLIRNTCVKKELVESRRVKRRQNPQIKK